MKKSATCEKERRLICHSNVVILLTYNAFFFIRSFEVDFILLAGFLKLIPVELIRAYEKSILNIHPSLLPAFGGKGYYGMNMHMHKAVIASGARYASHKTFSSMLF